VCEALATQAVRNEIEADGGEGATKATYATKAPCPSDAFLWLYRWLLNGPDKIATMLRCATEDGYSEAEIRAEVLAFPGFHEREKDGAKYWVLYVGKVTDPVSPGERP